MLTPADWFQRAVVALLLLTFVLLIHYPTNVRAAGIIEGHGRFDKIWSRNRSPCLWIYPTNEVNLPFELRWIRIIKLKSFMNRTTSW